jgi:hypothetical protein
VWIPSIWHNPVADDSGCEAVRAIIEFHHPENDRLEELLKQLTRAVV